MNAEEQYLLENLMDCLDRLFDRQVRVVDVHALFFATARALAASQFGSRLDPVVGKLGELVRKPCSEEARQDEALIITDDLRSFLADVLPFRGERPPH